MTTYIGDGVYAEWDGYALVLSTERVNGTNWVALEPDAWATLVQFVERIKQAALIEGPRT